MPRYRVSKGRELSHSERVNVVVPTFPKPATTVGYECRMLAEGDEVELPEGRPRGSATQVCSKRPRRSGGAPRSDSGAGCLTLVLRVTLLLRKSDSLSDP